MGLGNSKKKSKVKSDEGVAEMLRSLDQHVQDIQDFVPMSPNEQLLRYLQKTYAFGRKLKVKAEGPLQKALLSKLPEKMRMKGHFNKFKILLELQSPEFPSAKQRRRYARALLSARMQDVPSKDFVAFVKQCGGINKLGDSAILKAKNSRSTVPAKKSKASTKNGSNWIWGRSPSKGKKKAKREDWT